MVFENEQEMHILQKIVRKESVYERMYIDIDNIKKIEILENRRLIRNAMVNKIFLSLTRGIHFVTPLVVNEISPDKYRLIDGNHRFEAIKKFLEQNKNSKVEVPIMKYSNLSSEEETNAYDIIQNISRENASDYLQKHKEEIMILKFMQKDFPCNITIYGSQNGLQFKNIADAYLGAKLYSEVRPYTGNNFRRLKEYTKMNTQDYRFLKHFIAGFISTFGMPDKTNRWARLIPLTAILRIYYDNLEMGDAQFWTDFNRKVANKADIIELTRLGSGNRDITILLHKRMLDHMNTMRRKSLYIKRVRGMKEDVQAGEI